MSIVRLDTSSLVTGTVFTTASVCRTIKVWADPNMNSLATYCLITLSDQTEVGGNKLGIYKSLSKISMFKVNSGAQVTSDCLQI